MLPPDIEMEGVQHVPEVNHGGPLPLTTEAEPSGPGIEFGALCDPLGEQLERQGFGVTDTSELGRIEIIARAVAVVTIHGLMSPSQSDRARRKLVARLGKIVRKAAALARSEGQ